MQPGSFLYVKCKAERIPDMNKEHILLSISMLISGRDEMEKSLNSLLYFKNAFPTEIILVPDAMKSNVHWQNNMRIKSLTSHGVMILEQPEMPD